MATTTTTVRTAGGRALCVESGGDPEGRPILIHPGTPGSRILADRWLEDARSSGARLLSYDRPGYGGSTPQPGRSVADCAADVRAIAATFGIDRLAVWGVSGGGPHALACAALLPDLVCAVASLASIAPYGPPGLDFFAGMGQDNVDDIQLYLSDPEAARKKSEADRVELLQSSAEEVLRTWESLLCPQDAAVMTGEFASFLLASMQEGLAPGDEGWWEDSVAHLAPWGFELAVISVPVQLWHGRHDQFVPFQHGEWLAGQVPGVDAHLTETDGHLTLVERVPEVHRWLLGHF